MLVAWVLSHVHPDDLPAVLAGFQDSVATGEPRPLHYGILEPEEATTDVETVAQAVLDDDRRVGRVMLLCLEGSAGASLPAGLRLDIAQLP
jgi:hypothetical protein